MDGAESGKLQEILASRKKASATENDEVDALRQQAREALLEGAQSGKLLEMLYAKKNNADEVESLRTQARDALMDGMASGKLEEILSKKHEDEDVNQLRQQALQALLWPVWWLATFERFYCAAPYWLATGKQPHNITQQ